MKRVSSIIKNYLIDAVLLIAIGLVMLLWPQEALKTVFTQIGIAFIVMGAVKGIAFFASKDKESRSILDLLVGIVQIAIGVLFIEKSDFLVEFFPTVAAIILAYGAIIMIVRSLKLRNDNKNAFILSLVLGIVTLVLAAVIFVHPVGLVNVMTQATGVSMIIEGISLLIVLSRK